MSATQDYVSLDWIKAELFQTFEQAQNALQSVAVALDDGSSMRACLTAIHQVHGTLKMVQLDGPTQIAAEMEALAQGLMAESIEDVGLAQETLMQALLQMPSYLDRIHREQQDSPDVVVSLVNALRDAREAAPLPNASALDSQSTSAWFALEPNMDDLRAFDASQGTHLVKQWRIQYQQALTALVRKQKPRESLDVIAKVFTRLNKLAGQSAMANLFELGLAVIEGVSVGAIKLDAALVNDLKLIDGEMKILSNDGTRALRKASEALGKSLLSRVRNSSKVTPKITAAKLRFSPAETLTSPVSKSQFGPDDETLATVAQILIEELSGITDKLDLYVRSDSKHKQLIVDLASPLQQIASTLSVVGLEETKQTVLQQVNIIEQIGTQVEDASEDQLFELAQAFLQIEASLRGIRGVVSDDASNRFSGLGEAQASVIRETRNGLALAIDAVTNFVIAEFDTRKLEGLADNLRNLRGSLIMVGEDRPAEVLSACAKFIDSALTVSMAPPEQSIMEYLADAITSIDYYLERMLESATDPYMQMLEVAEEAVEKLRSAVDKSFESINSESINSESNIAESNNEDTQKASADSEPKKAVLTSDKTNTPLASDIEEAPVDHERDLSTASTALADQLVDVEILEIFSEEAEEVLATIIEYFPRWQANESDNESLIELRRAFHTLKGSGRMVGATVMGELAWATENLLNSALEGSSAVIPQVVGVVERVIERIPAGLQAFKDGVQDTFEVADLIDEANLLSANPNFCAPSVNAAQSLDHVAKADLYSENLNPEVQRSKVDNRNLADDSTPVEEFGDAESSYSATFSKDLTLFEIFSVEAEEKLTIINNYLAAPALLSAAVVAAFHTLKGSAAIAQVETIAQVAAPLEVLAQRLQLAGTQPSAVANTLIQRGFDLMTQVLNDWPRSTNHSSDQAGLLADIASYIDEEHGRRNFDFESVKCLAQPVTVLEDWSLAASEKMVAELESIKVQAEALTEHSLIELISALLRFYSDVTERPSAERLKLLANCHDALLNMFDQIAAHQDVLPATALIEALAESDQDSALISETFIPETAIPEISAPVVIEPIPAEDELTASAFSKASLADDLPLPEDQIDGDVLPLFLEEAAELIENIDQSIFEWSRATESARSGIAESGNNKPSSDSGSNRGRHLSDLLRHLHTLKGGARISGLHSLGEFAHRLETYLTEVEQTGHELNEEFFVLLNKYQDDINSRIYVYQSYLAGQVSAESLQALHFSPAIKGLNSTSSPGSASEMVGPAPVVGSNDKEAGAIAAESPNSASEVIDKDILGIFLEESSELLEAIDRSIHDWQEHRQSKDPLGLLLRHLHTLKGGARLAGLTGLGEFAHLLESFLSSHEQNGGLADDAFFRHLHQQQDELARRLDVYHQLLAGQVSQVDLSSLEKFQGVSPAAPRATDSSPVRPSGILEQSDSLSAPKARASNNPEAGVTSASSPSEMVRVSSDLLEQLINLAGEASVTRGRIEQQIADFAGAIEEMEETILRIREQVRLLDIETESRETVFRHRQSSDTDPTFDELELDRYTLLQEISRSLTEGSSDMMDLKDTLLNKSRDTETLLHQQARISAELQEGLTRTHMVPFARLIPRLRRIVRQISTEVGKSVRFDAFNVEGELDRTVLERIVAPLEHMLRNAVDHGIETAEERRLANKSETGRISLRLSREGGYVVLTVSDDGGGINVAAVKAKAIERGLIRTDEPVSDHEVRQFILHAGFSTATKLTQISGRGVGMDVVNNEIKQLGGTLAIDSAQGQGTQFVIRIPFTVSINRALMVVVKEETYAVPLNTIEGIVRVSPYELEAYYQPDAPMFEYAGQPYRLVYMGKMLERAEVPNFDGQLAPLPVILARSGDTAVALQVDRVIGSREVVVKTLGRQFSEVAGISGATVLGDGSVVIILDVMALVRNADQMQREPRLVDELEAQPHVRSVLIVDDSVTVRKVTSRLMERQGWEVVTAKDGLDAIGQLQEIYPDIVLLDIEMPRMDGFEVLRSVRRDERLKHLPIIMITSRTGAKHQQQAQDLGVNGFLGKPFQEAGLMSSIESVLASVQDTRQESP